MPSPQPTWAFFDPFEDMDELKFDVVVVFIVGFKHLKHLHKKMGATQHDENNAQCQTGEQRGAAY
jgi:hypothetical protein